MKILSCVCYTISLIFMSAVIFLEVFVGLRPIGNLMISAFAFILLIIGTVLNDSKEKSKTVKKSVWLLFIFYTVNLFILLFLSSRSIMKLLSSNVSYAAYFMENTNLIPFKSIIEFYEDFHLIAFVNIFGNIAAFAPMAFFIPVLFKRVNKMWKFALLMLTMIIAVEVLQFITMTGSMDIDDLILNFSGVIIAYLIMRTKFVKNILRRLMIESG